MAIKGVLKIKSHPFQISVILKSKGKPIATFFVVGLVFFTFTFYIPFSFNE